MVKAARPLKIGFVLDDGLDSEDGVQAYILTLGSWMERQGHDVHFLVGETKRKDIKNLHSLARNVRVSFNGNKLTIPLPVKTAEIRKFLAREQYDVIHIQMPYSPFFGAKVVAQAPPATVVFGTFHILPYGLLATIGTRLLGMALSRNLKHFDGYVSVSSAAQQFARRSFKITTDVVPNAIDISIFQPAKKRSSNKEVEILFLGRLVERKGCAHLLAALAVMKKKYPKLTYHLNVCGKGPLDDQLKAQAKELGIQETVRFAGFVTNQEKVRYMQNAELAVFPSYAGESFGIVLIEAMAAGAGVVIGGSNPGYASVLETIPETLVDVHDPVVFSELLVRFITDKRLYEDVHERQQRLVKKFDVNVVGQELLRRYGNCKINPAG